MKSGFFIGQGVSPRGTTILHFVVFIVFFILICYSLGNKYSAIPR